MKIYKEPLSEIEVNQLIKKYPIDVNIEPDTQPWSSQYDQRSAAINYAMIRDFKPKVVVEFGSRAGRCTRDIHSALLENGGDFIFKPYEVKEATRRAANENLGVAFGKEAPKVGGNIMEAKDLPKGIEYLFIDNDHDEDTTKWVLKTLIPWNCKDYCLVHFHDVYVHDDWEFGTSHGESVVLGEMYKTGKLPFTKVYWTYEEGNNRTSSWFQYKR